MQEIGSSLLPAPDFFLYSVKECCMKRVRFLLRFTLLAVVFTTISSFHKPAVISKAILKGAWQLQGTADEHIIIFTDDYFSYTNFNKATKQFVVTQGGAYTTSHDQIAARLEFNSRDSQQVGTTVNYPFTLSNEVLTITVDGERTTWERLDNGTAPLAGNWRITHRLQDGNVQAIHQSGGRKTVKLLSDKRFQWVAINTDTKEFLGTGGGVYTFGNGKYTEHIEFFSRDSSRVGTSLTFEGNIKKDGWHHSGLSSRGDRIYEVWNKKK
jgi:hypothetical protein